MSIPKVRAEGSGNSRSLGRQGVSHNTAAGKRLREALGEHEVSWLVGRSGLSDSTIRDAIKRGPSRSDVAAKLASALDVSIDWLLTGRTDRTASDSIASTNFDQQHEGNDLVEVAQIDPSYGLGAVIMDEVAAPEMRTFSRAWLRQITSSHPEELFWGRGRGNSMAETINDGEPLLIDRGQQTVRDTDLIWAFAIGDVGAIKRLRPVPDGTVRILSDNPAVPPDSAHGSEIHIFGRVVAVVKKL